MPVNRGWPPRQVHTRPRARPDNGRDLDHLSIGVQRHRGASRDKPRCLKPTGLTGPSGNPDARKRARDGLDPRGDPQIAAGQKGRLAHVADALGRVGLQQFQAAPEIDVAWHCRRRRYRVIGHASRCPVLARPHRQPVGKMRRGECQTIGDRLVHVWAPFPQKNARALWDTGTPPVGVANIALAESRMVSGAWENPRRGGLSAP